MRNTTIWIVVTILAIFFAMLLPPPPEEESPLRAPCYGQGGTWIDGKCKPTNKEGR